MPLPEIHSIKHRITQLIQRDEYRGAAQDLESFMNRLRNLNRRIEQMPFDDRNAVKFVLYTSLEKVLVLFEELDWLGPRSGPVAVDGFKASEAIHAYGVRFDKIEERLERVSLKRRLATFAILHRESEAALMSLERHRLLLKRRDKRNLVSRSRLRWN